MKKLENSHVHIFLVDQTQFVQKSAELVLKNIWVIQKLHYVVQNESSNENLFVDTRRCKLWIHVCHDEVFEDLHALLGRCGVVVY